jgi:hypothetical protein
MSIELKRYWFEFDIKSVIGYPHPIGYGCGITAYDLEDALEIMNKIIFKNSPRPDFKRVVENIDIRTLDQGHVIPNMSPPIYRGVWFPLGYDI